MTPERVLSIKKTPTHYRDLYPGPLIRSLDLRPLNQPLYVYPLSSVHNTSSQRFLVCAK
jgi:hypothetical protein